MFTRSVKYRIRGESYTNYSSSLTNNILVLHTFINKPLNIKLTNEYNNYGFQHP